MIKEDGSLTATIATNCQVHDVTGGILKKLKSAASIVMESKGETNVFVCGINTAAAYNAYTHGELLAERGTEFRLEKAIPDVQYLQEVCQPASLWH